VEEEVNRVPDRSAWLDACVIDWKRLYRRHALSLLINRCQFFLTAVDQLFFVEWAAVDQLNSKKIESNNVERSQRPIWFITHVWNRFVAAVRAVCRTRVWRFRWSLGGRKIRAVVWFGFWIARSTRGKI
jgi:hypothetical protein